MNFSPKTKLQFLENIQERRLLLVLLIKRALGNSLSWLEEYSRERNTLFM